MPYARIKEGRERPVDDDLWMYYEDDDFTDPWKTPEVAVWMHEHMGSSRFAYRFVPIIARHYRFIRPDRRGYGRSTVPAPGYPWSLSGWARDIRALLDLLQVSQAHFVCQATGSFVAAQFAADYPERVKSLMLMSFCDARLPPKVAEDFTTEGGVEAAVRRTMHGRFPNLCKHPECQSTQPEDPKHVEWHAQEKIRQPQQTTIEVLQWAPSVDITETLKRIKAPTLLLASEGDYYHPVPRVREVAKLIPNSQVKVLTGPDVVGYPNLRAPERCAQTWLEFAKTIH